MPFSLFNTLTGRKEPFEPLHPGRIGMYVCGPTVYDFAHLGHARSTVVFDVLARYLAYRFPEARLTFVRNYTDIDDKIIRRAAETHRDWRELATSFMREFDRDMEQGLGCIRPDETPRATEHVPEMLDLVRRLVQTGHAYAANGDVYFRVAAFPSYGQLSKRNLDDLKAGARVEVDERKADPLDFALWKAAKPGEPSWDSHHWGLGRPGWHLECSAMSMKYLGEQFDIHGGGQDLIFPHHENEIAQSEAATGKRPFARYWVHNGFVNINAEKMSKSLGNFVRLRDLLAEVRPEVVRQMLLSVHYRSPIEFAPGLLDQARRTLDYFYTFLRRVEDRAAEAGSRTPTVAAEGGLETSQQRLDGLQGELEKAHNLKSRFRKAMDDDLNTPVALAAMHEAVRAANRVADGASEEAGRLGVLAEVGRELREVGAVLGLLTWSPAAWFKQVLQPSGIPSNEQVGVPAVAAGPPEADIERRIAERSAARKARDFARADQIRRDLEAAGILLEDRAGGRTDWKRR